MRHRELVARVAAVGREGGPARFAAVVAVAERADDGSAADRVLDAAAEAGALDRCGLLGGGDGVFRVVFCHDSGVGRDGFRS